MLVHIQLMSSLSTITAWMSGIRRRNWKRVYLKLVLWKYDVHVHVYLSFSNRLPKVKVWGYVVEQNHQPLLVVLQDMWWQHRWPEGTINFNGLNILTIDGSNSIDLWWNGEQKPNSSRHVAMAMIFYNTNGPTRLKEFNFLAPILQWVYTKYRANFF